MVARFVLRGIRRAIYLGSGRGWREAGSVRPRTPVGGASPVQEVADGVFRLSVFDSNVYFIRSGSSWVLVDTAWAWGNCGRRIHQAAKAVLGPNARPAPAA